jgi:hypothetical protein
MKNLLLLFLIFSFTSLFSQEAKVTYLRAQSASMGVREDENSVVSIVLNNEVVSYPFHITVLHN